MPTRDSTRLRWLVCGLTALMLCSCRSVAPRAGLEKLFPARAQSAQTAAASPTQPAVASSPVSQPPVSQPTVAPANFVQPVSYPYPPNSCPPNFCPPVHGAPGFAVPYATGYAPAGPFAGGLVQLPVQAWTGYEPSPDPWRPPHINGPWPRDEYLFDGGDNEKEVEVAHDYSLHGLDAEDTIAHYDTKDGRTLVAPSNRVPIYAPRFASVRKVYGAKLHEQHELLTSAEGKTGIRRIDDKLESPTITQPLQPGRHTGTRFANTFRDRNRGIGMENSQHLLGAKTAFAAYEDFQLIRAGTYDNTEKARLWNRVQAAITWSAETPTQVVIESQMAFEGWHRSQPQETFQYELPKGKPRLRIVKVASKDSAHPGDEIEFTLRFDNIGDQSIGNVTIIDNLTTRLNYIDESQTCGVGAKFFATENPGESLTLRWELTEPLRVREGGVIRFKCRVR